MTPLNKCPQKIGDFLGVVLFLGMLINSPCVFAAQQKPNTDLSKSFSRQQALLEWHGSYGPGIKSTSVIRTQAHWQQAWKMVSKEPPVTLDTDHQMAIAIFIGSRPTGGYRVQIISIKPKDNNLVITYEGRPPAPDMFVTQAFTTPYLIKIIPHSDLNVVFKKIETAEDRRLERRGY